MSTPTPETDAFILSNEGFGPTDHQWRWHARRLERERDRLAEELTAVAADVLNKDVVLRDILTLARGLHQYGPRGMSRRTASAMLAALARVLPVIEVPPLIEPSAAECGQYADIESEFEDFERAGATPKPLQNQKDEVVSPSGFEPETL